MLRLSLAYANPSQSFLPREILVLIFCLSTIDLGLDGSKVSNKNFELPSLGKKLLQLSLDIHDGRGFSVIRGLNPADFSVEDLTLAYMGVSAHIADKRGRQDRKGNMLGMSSACLPYW